MEPRDTRDGGRMHLQSAVRCLHCDGTTIHLNPDRVGYGDRSA